MKNKVLETPRFSVGFSDDGVIGIGYRKSNGVRFTMMLSRKDAKEIRDALTLAIERTA